MTNVGNQPGYPYGSIPPEPRSASSWLWPALLGVGMVIAAGLVLLVALQLTNGGDDSIGTSDTTTTTTTTPTSTTTTTAAPAPTTSAPSASTAVGTTSPASPTLAPTTAPPAPTVAAPPAPTAAPQPTAPPGPRVTTATPAGGSCSSYTPDGSIPVRRCASGPLVAEIQNALRAEGFSIDADGFFGPGTEAAVLEFQAGRGLEQDGIVGPATYDALTG